MGIGRARTLKYWCGSAGEPTPGRRRVLELKKSDQSPTCPACHRRRLSIDAANRGSSAHGLRAPIARGYVVMTNALLGARSAARSYHELSLYDLQTPAERRRWRSMPESSSDWPSQARHPNSGCLGSLGILRFLDAHQPSSAVFLAHAGRRGNRFLVAFPGSDPRRNTQVTGEALSHGQSLSSLLRHSSARVRPGPDAAPPRRIVFDQRFQTISVPDAVQTGLTLGAYAPRVRNRLSARGALGKTRFSSTSPCATPWSPIRTKARRTAAVVSDHYLYVPCSPGWKALRCRSSPTTGTGTQLAAERAQRASGLGRRAAHPRRHKWSRASARTWTPCTSDPTYNDTCFGGSFASFPSGHASAAMVGAGLSCAHHTYLPLLGGGTADLAVCALGSAFGVVNGVARLAADRHYASDVVAGLVLGWGVGFGSRSSCTTNGAEQRRLSRGR